VLGLECIEITPLHAKIANVIVGVLEIKHHTLYADQQQLQFRVRLLVSNLRYDDCWERSLFNNERSHRVIVAAKLVGDILEGQKLLELHGVQF
jgi:hypothetical protein